MSPDANQAAAGPLRVSSKNPRYFSVQVADGRERAVYLTGSHIWNNLQDGMGPGAEVPDRPEQFDFDAYLRFLVDRGHNFIRLWRWEQIRSQSAGAAFHLNMQPQPWMRTGPGVAKDGRARFDLTRFDPSFFERLRDRVTKAGNLGIYVGVMLFDGWALHLSPAPDHIEGHPFHALNNINGVAAASINDLQVLPLHERVAVLQRAYVERVVDALHDRPNVLWEVANESTGDGAVTRELAQFLGMSEPPAWGDSTDWQYWVIDLVKRHEADRGFESHPIGMTMQYPVKEQTKVNEPLLRSRAEWISPGYDDEIFANGLHPAAPGAPPSRWYVDPPQADGTKVIISDTDHFAPGQGDALWAWKAFLRGQHPILMDFGLLGGVGPADPKLARTGVPPFDAFEPARFAMGDTRRYSDQVNLIDMEPRADLSTTGFALVAAGRDYLVLQPSSTGDPFGVRLEAGAYDVVWHSVTTREDLDGQAITTDGSRPIEFAPPFAGDGPAVLQLRRR